MAFVLGAIPFFLFAFGQRGVEPVVAILRVWSVYVPGIDKLSQTRTIPRRFRRDISGRESARERRLRGKMSAARHADNATCDLFPPSGMTAYQKDWLAIFSSKRATFLRRYITRRYKCLISLRSKERYQFICACMWWQDQTTCMIK